MTIETILQKYAAGELTFPEVLSAAAGLEWATRQVDPDGTIWYEGQNTIEDVDLAWVNGVITDEEREQIFGLIT